jgi:transposase
MSKRKTQTYTPEYRSEAIKLVLEHGLSVSDAATRLSMNQGTLAYWVTQARKGVKSASSIAGSQSSAELAAENKRLRKELVEARMERDILKKATAYFARASLPGTHS